MTEEKFLSIKARQVPDAEKRLNSDYILPSGLGLAVTDHAVSRMLIDIADRRLNRPSAWPPAPYKNQAFKGSIYA